MPLPDIRPGFSSAWMFPATRDEYEWARSHGTEAYYYLPQVNWTGFSGGAVVPVDTLNQAATLPSEQQLQIAAADSVLPITYGRDRLGARIADLGVLNGYLVMFCIWGRGPYDALEGITIDDADLPAGVVTTHYDGTQTTPDPVLAEIYGGGYADVLAGRVYSVLQVPPGVSSGFPAVRAIWRGRQLYDPRLDSTAGGSGPQRLADPATWAWSQNWALILADYLASSLYGMGRTLDWDSVAVVADVCDEDVAGAPRRSGGGLSLDKRLAAADWLDTLRSYAGAFVLDDGTFARLVADRPAAAVKHFSWAAGDLKSLAPLEMADLSQVPTAVEVVWTDTSQLPWTEASVVVKAAGVDAGTTPLRFSRVFMPGWHAASPATREATEILNKRARGNIATEAEVFDAGTVIEPGDVIGISAPVGLAAAPFRVTATSGSLGRYKLKLTRYDAAMYSDAVASYVTPAETNLPNPANPPAVTGVIAVEEAFQQATDGVGLSRLRVSWTPTAWPYLAQVRIEVYDQSAAGTPLVGGGTVERDAAATWVSPPLLQGHTYVAQVAFVSSLVAGAWGYSAPLPILGDQLPPTNVTGLTGFEVGGRVRMRWDGAVAVGTWRYEVRGGGVGVAWESATVLDRVIGLRFESADLAAGTYDILVKAVNSAWVYSVGVARFTIVVTTDVNAWLVGEYEFVSPSVSGMAPYTLGPLDTASRHVTEDGVLAATKFPALASTYSAVAATYNAVASQLTTEWHDFGVALVGNWLGQYDGAAALQGTLLPELDLSPDTVGVAVYPAMAAKATGRFARLKFAAVSGDSINVVMPRMSCVVNAIPREETLSATTSASGPVNVLLAGLYAYWKSIAVAASGAVQASGQYDNVRVNAYTNDGLQLGSSIAAGASGDQYVFWGFSVAGRTIAAGDYIEFDILCGKSPAGATVQGGVDIRYSDASYQRTYASACGVTVTDLGVWQHVSVALGATPVGKAVSWWDLVNHSDAVGDYELCVRNVRITDGAGTVRQTIYGASGAPAINQQDFASGYAANLAMNPANSLDVYAFNGTTKIATPVVITFKGV